MTAPSFIEPESLAAIQGRILFYPMAGEDWQEFLDLFTGRIDEFHFSDIRYSFSKRATPALPRSSGYCRTAFDLHGAATARMEQRETETGRSYRFIEPARLTETYERIGDGRAFKMIQRRGFGQYALAEFADRSIGIFVHRGDSADRGGGGSNVFFLANRKRDHEPCSNLFDKLSQKLADRALIISDGSNARIGFVRMFHRKRNCDETVPGPQAYERLRGKHFSFSTFDWRCVGYLRHKNGPTLVWDVARHEPSVTPI